MATGNSAHAISTHQQRARTAYDMVAGTDVLACSQTWTEVVGRSKTSTQASLGYVDSKSPCLRVNERCSALSRFRVEQVRYKCPSHSHEIGQSARLLKREPRAPAGAPALRRSRVLRRKAEVPVPTAFLSICFHMSAYDADDSGPSNDSASGSRWQQAELMLEQGILRLACRNVRMHDLNLMFM